jgi:triphosphatase
MRKLVARQTAERLKRLDREVRQVARKPKDADAIHDLRVSIRRLGQELRIFKAWFGTDYVKTIRRCLRKLMKRCGTVRNCDVAIEVLEAAGWKNPKLIERLEKERSRARDELAQRLKRWKSKDRVGEWRGHLRVQHSVSSESAAESATRLLPLMVDDLFRAGRAAARPDSDYRTMHRFRLETKRVRYTLEVFATVYGESTKQILESLKGLQEKLGAINDCAATIEVIRRNRGAAAAVRRLAGDREAEFRTHWKQHFGPREKMRWKAVVSAADGKK